MRLNVLTYILPLLATTTPVLGHTIFQRLSVNGQSYGFLQGVRTPGGEQANSPTTDLTYPNFACNTEHWTDPSVIPIPAGACVGAYFSDYLAGPKCLPFGDSVHPVHPSHKGPIIVFLAQVSNASTTTSTGLRWFKIAEDGYSSVPDSDSSRWASERMIAQDGWTYFTMPECIAPGDYLLSVEFVALHNAMERGGAQFFMECAQIRVTGGGTSAGLDFVEFPGAYSATHPGLLIDIYASPLSTYTIPGPARLQCPTSTPPIHYRRPTATRTTETQLAQPAKDGLPLYAQCGGAAWSGITGCAKGGDDESPLYL
ncbi:family 61 glycosyl hydrolase [Ephemerocybe angulata]|uniref:AA9 family lytic polysaccharide monooxygenase n=1 Tax=Ephemerocybe angulata TaxID=980116 RepID=A0A8H6LXM9_9AGAR|nr:family 61 glycosyl hydrolase [Tulosesus angulatus]